MGAALESHCSTILKYDKLHTVFDLEHILRQFNIVSEASYIYILSGQKLIKSVKIGLFWRVFENLKLTGKQCYQTGQLDRKWSKTPKVNF